MTYEHKQLIFDYMGRDTWQIAQDEIKYHISLKLDANDMITAMNTMVIKKHWIEFYEFAFDYWMLHIRKDQDTNDGEGIVWLMQPNIFFDLMGKFLSQGVHENFK